MDLSDYSPTEAPNPTPFCEHVYPSEPKVLLFCVCSTSYATSVETITSQNRGGGQPCTGRPIFPKETAFAIGKATFVYYTAALSFGWKCKYEISINSNSYVLH